MEPEPKKPEPIWKWKIKAILAAVLVFFLTVLLYEDFTMKGPMGIKGITDMPSRSIESGRMIVSASSAFIVGGLQYEGDRDE